jgi:hypothetical protein
MQQKSLNDNLWTLRGTTRIFAFKFLVSSSQKNHLIFHYKEKSVDVVDATYVYLP